MMDQKKTKGSQKPIVFAPSEEYPEIGLLDRIKQTKFGKAILGEDGSFDRKDAERLVRRAKDAVINAAESVIEVKKLTYTGAHEDVHAANEASELHGRKKVAGRDADQEGAAAQDAGSRNLPDPPEEAKERLKQD